MSMSRPCPAQPRSILALLVALPAFVVAAPLAAASPSPPAGLAARVDQILARAGGQSGVSIAHVPGGSRLDAGVKQPVPLLSVAKLPVAVLILKEVAAGRLTLERTLRVEPGDVRQGHPRHTARWQRLPEEVSIRELLDLSLVDSDNTSSDKLLYHLGGPAAASKALRALDLPGIDIKSSYRKPEHNLGTPAALTALLVRLAQGQLLPAREQAVLLDYMTRSPTGAKRLRGNLPPGTPVADKTGTAGGAGAVNDTGLVTLPGGKGQLAITVLLTRSKLPLEAQEAVIAEIARAAYDAYAPPAADAPPAAPAAR